MKISLMTPAVTVTCLGILAVACGPSCANKAENEPAVQTGDAGGFTGLPALYSGVLPCTDCEGTKVSVVLWPDSTFDYQQVYLGDRFRKPWCDLGMWTLSEGNLRLQGNSVHLFSVRNQTTLRKLDLQGREIRSELNYDLRRALEFASFDVAGEFDGMYSYMADAGVLAECRTGKRFPVAQEGENATLERSYLDARKTPAEPLYVRFYGRIVRRPSMEEGNSAESIVVERFLEVRTDKRCIDH